MAAAQDAAQLVQLGHLPCDALLLRGRAQAFIEFAKRVEQANLRQLLNEHPSILRFDPQDLQQRILTLLQLLPNYDGTALLRTVAPELEIEPQLLALKYMELHELFKSAFDANLPPSVFTYIIHIGSDANAKLLNTLTSAECQAMSLSSISKAHDPAPKSTHLEVATIQSRLQAMAQVFGREVAYMALSNTPQLLSLDPSYLQQQHTDLACLLRLPGLRKLYLLQNHGSLLCIPYGIIQRRHTALASAIRWPSDDADRLARQDPSILCQETDVIRDKWNRLRQLGVRRKIWSKELDQCTLTLASAVLGAGMEMYDRLEYLVASGLRPGVQLRQLVRESVEEFCAACPKYRRWLVLRAAGRDRLGAAGYSGLVRVQFD